MAKATKRQAKKFYDLHDEAVRFASFFPHPTWYANFYKRRIEPTMIELGIWPPPSK